MTSLITWHPLPELPDGNLTVLLTVRDSDSENGLGLELGWWKSDHGQWIRESTHHPFAAGNVLAWALPELFRPLVTGRKEVQCLACGARSIVDTDCDALFCRVCSKASDLERENKRLREDNSEILGNLENIEVCHLYEMNALQGFTFDRAWAAEWCHLGRARHWTVAQEIVKEGE